MASAILHIDRGPFNILRHPHGYRLRPGLAHPEARAASGPPSQSVSPRITLSLLFTEFPSFSARLSLEYNVPLLANNHSAFNSPSNAISDAAWASIEAGHGDVLLTPSEAASLGLPPSFAHPFRPEYQVYIIDAYHAMHCLKVLRDHYMRMYHAHRFVDDWPQLGDWPLEHDEHCFDSLRKHVMCHADDTLLYSTGHHDAGVRQTKMCRSWDALREWASGRNAQWKDHINPRPEGEIWWNFDDGGDDGLPRGGLS